MSSFEKIFIMNEILRALASAFSISDSFKKIFKILQNHTGITHAAVLTYDRHSNNFDAPAEMLFNVTENEMSDILKRYSDKFQFPNEKKDFKGYEKIFDTNFAVIFNDKLKTLFFPIYVNDQLAAVFLMCGNFDISKTPIDANLLEAISAPVTIIYEREKLFNETKDQKRGFEFLYNLSNEINKTLDAESILKISIKAITQKFKDILPVIVIDRGNIKTIMAAAPKPSDNKESGTPFNYDFILEDIQNNIGETVSNFNFKTYEVPLKLKSENIIENLNNKSFLWLSLNYNNSVSGYLGLYSIGDTLQNMNLTSIRFLTLAANQINSAIENARLYNEVERLASVDGMTNVFNYRYFYNHLVTEIQRASRYEADLSIIMIDIDHFKSFNDVYGHQAGDEVLREVGRILMYQARKIDIVARYGGEEFVLILPETSIEGATELAERIRTAIEQNDFKVHSKNSELLLKVTISLGVSNYRTYAETAGVKIDADKLIKAADESLYHAKHSGRNQVCYVENGSLKKYQKN